MSRRRRLVTHAFVLWILVVALAALFACTVAYLASLARRGQLSSVGTLFGIESPVPPATAFGTVLRVEGDEIRLDSKQPFQVVIVGPHTKITSLGGVEATLSSIDRGTRITVTGADLGEGRLAAKAIVVLQVAETVQSSVTPLWTGHLESGDAALRAWAEKPILGWFHPTHPDAVFAVKVYRPELPAASIEIYGLDGKLAQRIELDLPGFKHLKSGNPFLAPEQAAEAVLKISYAFSVGDDLFRPASLPTFEVMAPAVGAAGRLGLVIRVGDKEIEAIAPSDLSFSAQVRDPGAVRAWWSVSPPDDAGRRYLAALFTMPDGKGGEFRSVHLVDLKKLGVE